MNRGIFVTGTDTNIGKTTTCSLLISALKAAAIDCGYWKPIQTGTESDLKQVRSLSGLSSQETAPSTYAFEQPSAPSRAAKEAGASIELNSILQAWQKLSRRFWVIEGAGGMLVPLNSTETIRDLIQALEAPCLIVASTRLGTINHTLLTLEAARSRGVRVAGLALVGEEDPGLSETLQEWGSIPAIIPIPSLEAINPAEIALWGPRLFPKTLLKTLQNA